MIILILIDLVLAKVIFERRRRRCALTYSTTKCRTAPSSRARSDRPRASLARASSRCRRTTCLWVRAARTRTARAPLLRRRQHFDRWARAATSAAAAPQTTATTFIARAATAASQRRALCWPRAARLRLCRPRRALARRAYRLSTTGARV